MDTRTEFFPPVIQKVSDQKTERSHFYSHIHINFHLELNPILMDKDAFW